jgi:endoglucanase
LVPENTSKVGGGQNVGNINTGDWMSHLAVTIPTTGTYTVSYRVAGWGCGLQLERAGGTQVYDTFVIPSTDG